MLHTCVRKFDVISIVENFLGTKHPLSVLAQTSVSCSVRKNKKMTRAVKASRRSRP